MDLAVIRLNGKQFTVKNGSILKLDRLQKDSLAEVLLWQDGQDVEIGTPVLTNRSVKLEVLEDKLDKKVNVSRFKAKSRYRRHKGHRQPISVVKVTA
jgi:large subunit ribosomal protein L21